MGKNVENIICINMNTFNKILLITNNNSDLCLDSNQDSYLIENSIYSKVINRFENIIKATLREDISIKGASLARYNELKDEYEAIKYNSIRNEYNKIKSKKVSKETIYDLCISLYEEVQNIKKIPSLIKEITAYLNEIKNNNLSENINSYKVRFKSLVNNGGLYEDYNNLKIELESVIKKTYTERINTSITDDKNVYLVKEQDKVRILDTADLNSFTYGLIYSSNSIKRVTNEGSDAFVSFNNMDFDTSVIELNDDKPIGIYAVTYGEHSISPNYNKAKSIFVSKDTPFKEFDKTLLMNEENYSINELIDNLLIDSNLEVVVNNVKDQSYYNLYKPFFEKFKNLKFGSYTESNIINLFDVHLHFVNDQKFLDLNNLLFGDFEVDEIRTILKINKFYDFNIFRNTKVDKTKINQFLDVFYEFKDNEKLNEVYPGIWFILEEFKKASDKKTDELISIINSLPLNDRDSYFIAHLFDPKKDVRYLQGNALAENTFVRPQNDKNIGFVLRDYLRSNDQDVARVR